MGHNRFNLIGQKFGSLTVLSSIEDSNKHNQSIWECQCDCGIIKTISGVDLVNQHTKSCGCLRYLKHKKGAVGFRRLLNNYKKSAKNRNLKFSITEEKFKKLTSSNCYYCGESPSNIKHNHSKTTHGIEHSKYIYNGIDRKDNNKGYTIENCVPCCGICNKMKSTMNIDNFLNQINKIKDNRKYETNNLILFIPSK